MTLDSCCRCLEAADAGARAADRNPDQVRKAGFINFNVATDAKVAKAALLRKLAFLFRSKGHAENIRSSGLDIDHASIIAAVARRDIEAAVRLLPEKAATVFGVAGTPGECREQLEAYLSVGMSEPIIEITGNEEERSSRSKSYVKSRVVEHDPKRIVPMTPPPNANFVALKDVRLIYGRGRGTHAVEALDLTVEQGEFAAVVGPSGCGNPR